MPPAAAPALRPTCAESELWIAFPVFTQFLSFFSHRSGCLITGDRKWSFGFGLSFEKAEFI